MTVLKPSV